MFFCLSWISFCHHERVSDSGDWGGSSDLPPYQVLPPAAEPAGSLWPPSSGKQEKTPCRWPSPAGPGRPDLLLRSGGPSGFPQAAGHLRVPLPQQSGNAVHHPEPEPEGKAVGERFDPGIPGEDGRPGQSPHQVPGVRDADHPGVGRGQEQLRGGVWGDAGSSIQRDVHVWDWSQTHHGHGLDEQRPGYAQRYRPPGVRWDSVLFLLKGYVFRTLLLTTWVNRLHTGSIEKPGDNV